MAVNDQYSNPPFGLGGDGFVSTGAPGSGDGVPESSRGPAVGTVPVTPVYGSSQVPQPSATVYAGDTAAFLNDGPVPASGDPLTGLSLAQVTETGAGQGHAYSRNPNAGR